MITRPIPQRDATVGAELARMRDENTERLAGELDRLRSANAELLALMEAIQLEVMDFPPQKPYSSDSYLPIHFRLEIERVIAKARGTQ